MADRAEVLDRIVALAREHDLSAQEISQALDPQQPADQESQSSVTSRILATIGGIFILCGLGFFIETFWAEMNAAARIILSLGSGVVMLVLALVFMRNTYYERTTLPLFLLAALMQSGGIMVAFDELGTGGDPQLALLAMSVVMLLQTLIIFREYRLAVHVFLALVFAAAAVGNLLDIIGMDWDLESTLTGLALLVASFRLNKTAYNTIVPFWFFVGGALTGYGLFDLLEGTPVHLLYVAYPALMIYFSTLAKSRTLLFVGTCAMIGYLGWFTSEYFADSIGWPLALIIIGGVFIALSVFAVKISRDYITGSS